MELYVESRKIDPDLRKAVAVKRSGIAIRLNAIVGPFFCGVLMGNSPSRTDLMPLFL
jgi:hypothetical protein